MILDNPNLDVIYAWFIAVKLVFKCYYNIQDVCSLGRICCSVLQVTASSRGNLSKLFASLCLSVPWKVVPACSLSGTPHHPTTWTSCWTTWLARVKTAHTAMTSWNCRRTSRECTGTSRDRKSCRSLDRCVLHVWTFFDVIKCMSGGYVESVSLG